MEKGMMDIMYEIPSNDNIAECILSKGAVEGTQKPRVTYRDRLLQAE